MTILVVNDDPTERRLYRDALEGEGYRVMEDENGNTTMDLLRRASVDLVVLDIQMQGAHGLVQTTHGLELLKRIHMAWPRLSLVLCSGMPKLFDELVVWEATAQVAGLLGKPVELRALLDVVRRALTASSR